MKVPFSRFAQKGLKSHFKADSVFVPSSLFMVEGERLNVTFVNFLWVRSVLAGIEMNSYNYLQTLPGLDWSLTWGLRRTSIWTFHLDS